MNLEHYEFRIGKLFLDYEFESEGPKGLIKKVVRYTRINIDGIIYYNLGFGDTKPNSRKIDDFTVSDNKDRDKVLATVAATAIEFFNHFPSAKIHAKGSTASRTRLYRMAISANLTLLTNYLNIWGFKDGKWTQFRKNINYEAFAVMRKKM